MSELIERLNREADEHEKFYPSDTLHGMLREAVARITELEAEVGEVKTYHEPVTLWTDEQLKALAEKIRRA